MGDPNDPPRGTCSASDYDTTTMAALLYLDTNDGDVPVPSELEENSFGLTPFERLQHLLAIVNAGISIWNCENCRDESGGGGGVIFTTTTATSENKPEDDSTTFHPPNEGAK